MAELVDAHDSKSCPARGEGSIPSFGTYIKYYTFLVEYFIYVNEEKVNCFAFVRNRKPEHVAFSDSEAGSRVLSIFESEDTRTKKILSNL